MTANLALELGCCASLVRCWLAGIASIAGSSRRSAMLRLVTTRGEPSCAGANPLCQQCHGVC